MTAALYVFGALFVACNLIKLLRIDHWVVRFFDFPQLQFLCLGAIVTIASIIWLNLGSWVNIIFLSIVVVNVAHQVFLIYPYTILYPKQMKNAGNKLSHDLKIVVSNVYQPNTSYQKVLDLVDRENPDIVLLVETNKEWYEQMKVLEDSFAYSLIEPLENMYGLLFYSRLALKEAEVRHIIKDEIPSVKTKIILKSGREVQFFGVHPEPPSPTENYRSTERDAELYLLAKEIQEQKNLPTVVAGDLNDVAWSKSTRIFQKLSGLLDPRKGRGFFNTFHAKYPIRWPLDHFFLSHHFQIVDIKVLDSIGSDHFPISISINFAQINQNETVESTDESEIDEVERQINKAESD